jgi:hypothetical protein
MATYRTPPLCLSCGEEIEAVYADRGNDFVGDSFSYWDYDGHKCKGINQSTPP